MSKSDILSKRTVYQVCLIVLLSNQNLTARALRWSPNIWPYPIKIIFIKIKSPKWVSLTLLSLLHLHMLCSKHHPILQSNAWMSCQRKTKVIKLSPLQSEDNGNQSWIVKWFKSTLIKVNSNNLDTLLKTMLDSRISSHQVVIIMRSGASIWSTSVPNI